MASAALGKRAAVTVKAATPEDWRRAYPAPAKLNLFLHVVGRRADGYHRLQTLFHFIDRADTLRFSPRADGAVTLAAPLPGVPPDEDLTVRAARLLQTETGSRQGVTIHVEKRLPMGGGLGGGSSDAATVLLALNRLWELDLPRPRLQEIGLKLGADVPVFIFGRNAFAESVGEALQAAFVPPAWYVVLEPPVSVATATIFAAPELKRDSAPIRAADWRPGFGGNDLQAVALARFPVIAEYLNWLSAFGDARLTGSGACVFVALSSRATAEAVVRQRPPAWRGWLARGLARHPLFGEE